MKFSSSLFQSSSEWSTVQLQYKISWIFKIAYNLLYTILVCKHILIAYNNELFKLNDAMIKKRKKSSDGKGFNVQRTITLKNLQILIETYKMATLDQNVPSCSFIKAYS